MIFDKLHYYPFIVSMNRCYGSCNTVGDPVCTPNKIEEVIESRTLTKHILCECRCEFYGRKCNLGQKWNNDKCQCECEKPVKHRICEEDYV